jgi:hypothetical protein
VGRRLVGSAGKLSLAGAPVLGSRIRAHLNATGDLTNVRFASGFVPALITGVMSRHRRRVHRGIAIAVNGRVVAVARTFYLGGSRRESFAALVPEWAFHAGRNQVTVLAARRRGRRLLVRSLGGI